MRIIDVDALKASLSPGEVISAVREAFIRHAAGDAVSPPPGQLTFDIPPGDCHIKFGYFRGAEAFVIKVATGFYDNPRLGLPVNDGLVLVHSARTGRLEALLQDNGLLTSWRTAAAGALAAKAGAADDVRTLGIVGTGHQAMLQAEWTARHLGIKNIRVYGRSLQKANGLARHLSNIGFETRSAPTVEALLDECRLVVACTPATAFVVPEKAVQPGTHIVGLGADMPRKQELDPKLFGRAAVVMCDDIEQCIDHGDLSYAVRSGVTTPKRAVLLGDVLAGRRLGRTAHDDVTITDLTGIPAQDVAIAVLALATLGDKGVVDM